MKKLIVLALLAAVSAVAQTTTYRIIPNNPYIGGANIYGSDGSHGTYRPNNPYIGGGTLTVTPAPGMLAPQTPTVWVTPMPTPFTPVRPLFR